MSKICHRFEKILWYKKKTLEKNYEERYRKISDFHSHLFYCI